MEELKEVTISFWVNEKEIEKAAEIKQIMRQYNPVRYKNYEPEDILRNAVVISLPKALNELKETYEWLAKYEKEHPEEVGDANKN